jgi:hypothetical protein
MDEDFVERRPGDIEMYRRLDAFAQMRLAPDAAAMARIRSALMGQALAMADARAASLALPTQQPAIVVERPSLSALRMPVTRGSAAFLAACLTLGIVAGSVTASAAGGPLYGPRLWLEEANLPSAPLAHANGQLDRLDARLEEIRVAVTSGNAGATEAALVAYTGILEDLETQALADPAVADQVLDDIARRQVVLTALLGKVPPQAQDALEQALQQGANAVEAIGDDGNPGDPVRRGGGGPGSGHDSDSGSGSGGSGSGGSGSGGSGSGGSGSGGSGSGGSNGQTGTGQDGSNKPDDPPGQAERTPRPEPTPNPPKAPHAAPTPEPPQGPTEPADGSESGGGRSSRQSQAGDQGGNAD